MTNDAIQLLKSTIEQLPLIVPVKFVFADNSLDIKMMNGNGRTFHDDPKLSTNQSTGINEKTSLLRRVNISSVAQDASFPFSNRFQSNRKYDNGIL